MGREHIEAGIVCVYLGEDITKSIKAYARKRHWSVSKAARQIIGIALKKEDTIIHNEMTGKYSLQTLEEEAVNKILSQLK